jgi:hypothetical protein
MQDTTTYKTPSKMRMLNYSLLGFLIGFPGTVLVYYLMV